MPGLAGNVVLLQLLTQCCAIDAQQGRCAAVVAGTVREHFLKQGAFKFFDQRFVQGRRSFPVQCLQIVANAGLNVVAERHALGLQGSVGHDL